MADEKEVRNENEREDEACELNLEDLDEATGGSLKNVSRKSTSRISSSTRSKI